MLQPEDDPAATAAMQVAFMALAVPIATAACRATSPKRCADD